MWLHAKLGKDRIIGKLDISRCKLESPNHPIGAFGVQMPKKPTPTGRCNRRCWRNRINWMGRHRVCVKLNINHSPPWSWHRLGRCRSCKRRKWSKGSILSGREVPLIEIGPFTDDCMLRGQVPELPAFVSCGVAYECALLHVWAETVPLIPFHMHTSS